MDAAEYQHLRGFLGAYFNQDWCLDYPTLDAVFDDFRRWTDRTELTAICDQIDLVLGEFETISDDFMLNELWCYFWPGDDSSNAEFLRLVKAKLQAD